MYYLRIFLIIILDNECNVWDVGDDCATNIRTEPKKGVVAATFNKLVEKITSERDHGESGTEEPRVMANGVVCVIVCTISSSLMTDLLY